MDPTQLTQLLEAAGGRGGKFLTMLYLTMSMVVDILHSRSNRADFRRLK